MVSPALRVWPHGSCSAFLNTRIWIQRDRYSNTEPAGPVSVVGPSGAIPLTTLWRPTPPNAVLVVVPRSDLAPKTAYDVVISARSGGTTTTLTYRFETGTTRDVTAPAPPKDFKAVWRAPGWTAPYLSLTRALPTDDARNVPYGVWSDAVRPLDTTRDPDAFLWDDDADVYTANHAESLGRSSTGSQTVHVVARAFDVAGNMSPAVSASYVLPPGSIADTETVSAVPAELSSTAMPPLQPSEGRAEDRRAHRGCGRCDVADSSHRSAPTPVAISIAVLVAYALRRVANRRS